MVLSIYFMDKGEANFIAPPKEFDAVIVAKGKTAFAIKIFLLKILTFHISRKELTIASL